MVFILQYEKRALGYSLFYKQDRQISIIKFFRYNLYITGSHFGERFTNVAQYGGGGELIDGKSEAGKI